MNPDPFLILATLFFGSYVLALLLGLRALKTIERLTSELAAVKSPEAALARAQADAALEAARRFQPEPAPSVNGGFDPTELDFMG